jgi:hypothetical protein
VAILAQADMSGNGKMQRFVLRADTDHLLEEDKRLAKSISVNPAELGELEWPNGHISWSKSLVDFVKWCKTHYAAQRYMLVIWGHGSGWLSEMVTNLAGATTVRQEPHAEQTDFSLIGNNAPSFYLVKQASRPAVIVNAAKRVELDKLAVQLKKAGVKFEMLANLSAAKDIFSPSELEAALGEIQTALGQKLDILGLDACLMGMVEVAYQVRARVDYLVASEDVEPLESWPYATILAKLVTENQVSATPTPPHCLVKDIVRKYVYHYKEHRRFVTQSGCDLTALLEPGQTNPPVERFFDAVNNLAAKLIAAIQIPFGSDASVAAQAMFRKHQIMTARSMTQTYYVKEFADLYDFCRILSAIVNSEKSSPVSPIETDLQNACQGVMDAIASPGAGLRPFVTAYGYYGYPVKDSHGVTIYFPARNEELLTRYGGLAFCQPLSETRWNDFLAAFLSTYTSLIDIAQEDSDGNALVKGTRTDESKKSVGEPIRVAPESEVCP